MPTTVTASSYVREGGYLVVSVVSDAASLQISSNLAYGFDGPISSNRLAYQGAQTVAAGSYDIKLRLYDGAVVGSDGSYQISGTIQVNGTTFTLNQAGVVHDNDTAQFTVSAQDVGTDLQNLLRQTPDPFLVRQFTPGAGDDRTTLKLVEDNTKLDSTTSVAVTAYQFFTGKIPSLSGIDYLVSSSTNVNNLNSAYYYGLNTENRYINFAANLGIYGEGASAFQSAYVGLTMHDAIVKAYGEIVGADNPAAVASIESSTAYFQQIARERIGGPDLDLSAKAAMVGYVLEEAVKVHAGLYGTALENFYLDLADGGAMTGVSLVGTYGPGTYVDSLR